MTGSSRDALAYPDHPDNALLELDFPAGILVLHLGHDWDAVPWPYDHALLDHREWTLLLDAQRLLRGEPIHRDESEVRAWLAWVQGRDVVLDWVPGKGFRYLPRRAGIDVGLVRRREPEPGPCVRVVGLATGSGGCLTHGLSVGDPARVPLGCQLVPALVCDICWRVAHVQLRPRAHLPVRFTEECRRCRAAIDLLPRWATRGPERRRRPRAQVAVSRRLLAPMAAMVDAERSETPWVPYLQRTVIDGGEIVTVDQTADRAPEPAVSWRDWNAAHPPSAEASASAAVALVERALPEGMPLWVDARALAGQLRWEVGE